jgi:hypothetical protein
MDARAATPSLRASYHSLERTYLDTKSGREGRRLLELAAVDRRQDYVAAAQRYADHLWAKRRRQLFEQAAVVQMYAALAARCGG